MTSPVINVSLVEDHKALAGELQTWIAGSPGLRCQAVYHTAEQALSEVPRNPPDVLLVDLRLPGMSGAELIRKLRALCPKVQCLVLTMYSESELIFEALKAGACGYLLKRTTPQEIAEAVRQVHAGGSVMTPRVARRVLEMFANPPPVATPVPADDRQLTDREKAVLQCMARGLARKQIVDSVGLNPHTLDYVIRCIYRKLHVNCAAAAVSVAVRKGIVASEP
ncbi:MAG: response regulator transcription factor [Verrucomicrobiae bacterium]|nr:response regulator transcription factor [Verrucomicrobiae bacterium]MDW8309270.1 response regulator transcription factor [Verrucomicrobiales bacterium]